MMTELESTTHYTIQLVQLFLLLLLLFNQWVLGTVISAECSRFRLKAVTRQHQPTQATYVVYELALLPIICLQLGFLFLKF